VAGPSAPVEGEPLTVPSRSGEQLDPCSLTGAAAYEPAGTARLPGKPTMDECVVSVATDEGPVVVRVGARMRHSALGPDRGLIARLGRGATVERYGENCEMALVLAGDMAIDATATGERASDGLLCELTEGAATGVFNVLAGGRAKFWTPDPNSFATLDACELLRAESVYQQLDVDGKLERSATGHWCRWGGNASSALLRFPVAESPGDAGVPAGTPSEPIGGRESWVVATTSQCTVYTQHIEFEPGVGTFEFAALTVTMPDPCTAARALAAQAWAELPN
jgi:hypothetical protein